jgi:hypothetical protein
MHIMEFMSSEISGSHHSDFENIWNKSMSMPGGPKFVKKYNNRYLVMPWK